MKDLPKFPKGYFQRFKTTPVLIKPFNPQTQKIAKRYIAKLQKTLHGLDIKFLHRGATAFGIAGKGDIEIGVYPGPKDWPEVFKRLKKYFGEVGNLEENYARFNDQKGDFEIEIIMLKGHPAKADIKLVEYLKKHPELLKEYEAVKKKFAYSRREYEIQKDKFLRKIRKMIPGG